MGEWWQTEDLVTGHCGVGMRMMGVMIWGVFLYVDRALEVYAAARESSVGVSDIIGSWRTNEGHMTYDTIFTQIWLIWFDPRERTEDIFVFEHCIEIPEIQ